MGETRVDLFHLLEDLRDAYPGSLEETLLTEIVANSLDSGASRIAVATDPAQSALTVVDNGSGMKRRELARYHDVAASRKERGEGIGFAGVGIKLGLLASEQVLTETRRGKTHAATRWSLASRHRAPWNWVPPPGLVGESGTAVCLKLSNPLSPLLDSGFLESALRTHFESLLEPELSGMLRRQYPAGVAVTINARLLEKEPRDEERAAVELRIGRRRLPSAVGYLVRPLNGGPLAPERRGLAVSTLGKVIKRGWDWLGVSPADPERVGGLIEAPGLAACLTLNKADFIRAGPKGATYLAYRKAIQEAVSAQLAAWGDGAEQSPRRERRTRPLERDLEAILIDLAEEFPLLDAVVEKHLGGQRRLAAGNPVRGSVEPPPPLRLSGAPVAEDSGEREPPLSPEKAPGRKAEPNSGASQPGNLPSPASAAARRPGRYGLKIQFEKRPESAELGRLVESTLWVNDAHPAYARAVASRSEGYHIALAAALALASITVEPERASAFVTAFFQRWGEALDRPARRRRRQL